jgi:hypothetical protein
MSQTLSVHEMASHFTDYLERVSSRRESFVLMEGSLPVAELRPLPAGLPLSALPGLLASLPHLDEAEAERFGEDLEAARSELSRMEPSDPWAS